MRKSHCSSPQGFERLGHLEGRPFSSDGSRSGLHKGYPSLTLGEPGPLGGTDRIEVTYWGEHSETVGRRRVIEIEHSPELLDDGILSTGSGLHDQGESEVR